MDLDFARNSKRIEDDIADLKIAAGMSMVSRNVGRGRCFHTPVE